MATLVCTFTLSYNQRGITATQLVAVFTWLLGVQTAAGKVTPTAYGCNISVPSINVDSGVVTAIITLTATQTAAFAAADVQTILTWVQNNVTGSSVLPAGVSLIQNYSWTPT